MIIHCDNCNQIIPADNINLDNLIAKCDACNSITSFADNIKPNSLAESQPQASQPSCIKIDQSSHNFRMSKRWFNSGYVFLLIFSLFFGGIPLLILIQNILEATQDGSAKNIEVKGILFLIPFFLIGACTFYSGITGIINRTTFTLSPEQLRVQHGPLPWWGNINLDPAQIKQFHVKKSSVTVNDQPRYNVLAEMLDGKEHMIAPRVEEKGYAYFIEQTLEQQTGISAA
ncbi:hypothetical protein [Poriferisphaera sp. WC338]|uniref:hypothetical protein n=1 Tax=Poriferisphaera sp. WC338 TaxID=3425129 RepID=UPI003D819DC9